MTIVAERLKAKTLDGAYYQRGVSQRRGFMRPHPSHCSSPYTTNQGCCGTSYNHDSPDHDGVNHEEGSIYKPTNSQLALVNIEYNHSKETQNEVVVSHYGEWNQIERHLAYVHIITNRLTLSWMKYISMIRLYTNILLFSKKPEWVCEGSLDNERNMDRGSVSFGQIF